MREGLERYVITVEAAAAVDGNRCRRAVVAERKQRASRFDGAPTRRDGPHTERDIAAPIHASVEGRSTAADGREKCESNEPEYPHPPANLAVRGTFCVSA